MLVVIETEEKLENIQKGRVIMPWIWWYEHFQWYYFQLDIESNYIQVFIYLFSNWVFITINHG